MIAESAARRPTVVVVFDRLRIGGDDLRALPLFERRQRLHQHIQPAAGIRIIEHIETHGEPLFKAIVDVDHEGIVAKRMDAPYRAGPHNAWLKIKNRNYSRRGAVVWRGSIPVARTMPTSRDTDGTHQEKNPQHSPNKPDT